MFVAWCQAFFLFLTVPQTAPVPPATADVTVSQTARIAALRAKAREQMARERALYSESELQDIEARYRAAHRDDFPMLRDDGAGILLQLIADYPKSNRAGCAVLHLARLAASQDRERYLKSAIGDHGDAWCESGVQVGALARARLAVYYAGQEKWDDAERLAEEIVRLFPGAIDESGSPLEHVLEGIRLLKHLGDAFDGAIS
jgi:hypothetical protein